MYSFSAKIVRVSNIYVIDAISAYYNSLLMVRKGSENNRKEISNLPQGHNADG